MKPVLVIERRERDARHLEKFVVQAGFDCVTVSLEERGLTVSSNPVPIPPDDRRCSLILVGGLPAEMEFESYLRVLEKRFPQVPVVAVTEPYGISTKDALHAGVAGCVPHDNLASDLAWTLQRIHASRPADHSAEDSAAGPGEAICHTLNNDPLLLPLVVAQVRQRLERWPFADPIEVLRVMVALNESLDNALYHGNLELSSELRQGDGRAWRDESQRRRTVAPYCDRKIRFQAVFGGRSARFTIRDEGPGFDPFRRVDCTESQNRECCSGRGLLLMQLYVDEVHFNPAGNEVTLVKHRP